ncbi:MAG TPA: RluA family pseudouridine synthase [Patescibacteria group bacterium]|nr:RluA family pseudouridine synthase [Patescibacteria group bacterium]
MQRLDYLVSKQLNISRSIATKLVKEGKVKVKGVLKQKPSQKISEDAELAVQYNESSSSVTRLDIEIIYEDQDCIVINKPAGILVHSKGAFNIESTVASWLLDKTKGFDDNNRAGIVHRLDRSTSGVMICAKNPESLKFFQKQFSARKVKKVYAALIEGNISPKQAVIDIPIERNAKDPKRFKASSSGKPALTSYKVIKSFNYDNDEYTLMELMPKTGRTHQLRVHLAYMKHPIIGDDFYKGIDADRLYLHATSLEITLTNTERKVFTSELPKEFYKPKATKT